MGIVCSRWGKVIQTPNFPDSMPSGVEVIERKEVLKTTGNGKDIYNQQLIVSAYDSGFLQFLPLKQKYLMEQIL